MRLGTSVKLFNSKADRGWRLHLRDNYDNDFALFVSCSMMYSIAERLGFDSEEDAWEANPIIQGSVYPEDLKVIA